MELQKENDEKRVHEIRVRVTKSEWVLIKENSEKPKVAQWIRELVLDKIRGSFDSKNKRRKIKKVSIDPVLLRQLVGIGNNINQLARVANTQGDLPTLVALANCKNELERLRKDLRDSQISCKR